jgi:DNA repair protein SbcD/Mre11
MRILHFADLHLGVENYGRPDPATGLSTRLADFLRVFDDIVDYALNNEVDLVLFSGDAYKSREPTPTQQREFARRINRLASNDIAVFLLIGNHDLPNAVGKATATEIFDTLAIKNVYVSGRPGVIRIETKHGPIQVASLPWPRRSLLLGKEETKGLDLEQIKQKIEESLTRIIENQVAQLDPKIPAVLAAHVWVTGCRTGSEKMITIGQDHALMPSTLGNPAFDYVALGHIHKQQVLKQSPPVIYAGSPERLDFSEEDDEKGFYIVDITQDSSNNQRSVNYTFHPLEARRFLSLNVSIKPEDTDPTSTILNTIESQKEKVQNAVVRVAIDMPASAQGLIRENELKEALSEAYHATIAREIKDNARIRLGTLTGSELTPLEALKAWLETKKTTPERAKILLEYGERLVNGETETI